MLYFKYYSRILYRRLWYHSAEAAMAGTSAAVSKKRLSGKPAPKTTRKKTTPIGSEKAPEQNTQRRTHRRSAPTRLLSKTMQRAKWVEEVDEHEDRPGQSLATRNHEVIRQWVEKRGAHPATIPSGSRGNRPRVLRFDFPGHGGVRRLVPITWEEWFRTFDERELVFVYQEHLKKGSQSNFFRLDSPEREAA